MAVTAKRYDAISYRLMENGEIVGMALQLANGRWGMFRADCETRIGDLAYATPGEVANHFYQLSH